MEDAQMPCLFTGCLPTVAYQFCGNVRWSKFATFSIHEFV
jgi:hypothetical protein